MPGRQIRAPQEQTEPWKLPGDPVEMDLLPSLPEVLHSCEQGVNSPSEPWHQNSYGKELSLGEERTAEGMSELCALGTGALGSSGQGSEEGCLVRGTEPGLTVFLPRPGGAQPGGGRTRAQDSLAASVSGLDMVWFRVSFAVFALPASPVVHYAARPPSVFLCSVTLAIPIGKLLEVCPCAGILVLQLLTESL